MSKLCETLDKVVEFLYEFLCVGWMKQVGYLIWLLIFFFLSVYVMITSTIRREILCKCVCFAFSYN